MDARDFTTDSRLLDLMPAIHASLALFNSSNNADPRFDSCLYARTIGKSD